MSVGTLAVVVLARWARRIAVRDRLRPAGPSPGRLPSAVREPLQRALGEAELAVTPEDAGLLWSAAVVVGAGVGYLLGGTGTPLGMLAGAAAGPVTMRIARSRAERRANAQVPDLLEAVARELRAGVPPRAALIRLGGDGLGPAELLKPVAARLRLGLGLPEALQAWDTPGRSPATRDALRSAGAGLRVAAETGGSSAAALDGLAAAVRDRQAVAAEARALSAQGRWSAVVVGALPLVSLVASASGRDGTFAVLTATTAGRLCLVAGLALESLAVVWMRRIVRVPW